MSYFLQNLIDRHQENGVSREVNRKVQPRPKTIFETDSGSESFAQNDLFNSHDFTQATNTDSNTGLSSTQYNPDAIPTTAAGEQSSRHTQIPRQYNIDKPAIQPDSSHRIDDLKERIEAVTLQLGRRSPVLETPISASENKSYQQTEDQPELPKIADQSNSQNLSLTGELSIDKPVIQPDSSHSIDDLKERMEAVTLQLGRKLPVLETPISATEHNINQQIKGQSELPEIAEQSNSQNLALPDELNQNIQTILHSLNSQQPQQTEDQREVESRREHALPDTDHTIPIGTVQLPVMPETTSDFAQPAIKVKKQSMESLSEQRESHQSGLLQIPNWLTEMQADLNNRWQELNTKAKTEPVVNVTIGRVEVRAVQSVAATQQPKAQKKPSGVMSLDDYLKQRENRGRA